MAQVVFEYSYDVKVWCSDWVCHPDRSATIVTASNSLVGLLCTDLVTAALMSLAKVVPILKEMDRHIGLSLQGRSYHPGEASRYGDAR